MNRDWKREVRGTYDWSTMASASKGNGACDSIPYSVLPATRPSHHRRCTICEGQAVDMCRITILLFGVTGQFTVSYHIATYDSNAHTRLLLSGSLIPSPRLLLSLQVVDTAVVFCITNAVRLLLVTDFRRLLWPPEVNFERLPTVGIILLSSY